MAYTLAQLAKLEVDPLRKYVIMNLLRDAKLMELIPWVNVDSLTVAATRWRVLPTVAFRAINAAYTANEGDTEQVWESLYIMGKQTLPILNLTVCWKIWRIFRYQVLEPIFAVLAHKSCDAIAL